MAPMFILAMLPSAMGCSRFSYFAGISMEAWKMVSGRISWGTRTSMAFDCKWQFAQASLPFASRGFL
eukprot:14542356-Heterocapsa_arctica.AAC.1